MFLVESTRDFDAFHDCYLNGVYNHDDNYTKCQSGDIFGALNSSKGNKKKSVLHFEFGTETAILILHSINTEISQQLKKNVYTFKVVNFVKALLPPLQKYLL